MDRGIFYSRSEIMSQPDIPGIDLQQLAREIAMRMDPEALLEAADVGAYLKCSARYVQEEYLKSPGFPKPLRLTGPEGRRGNARWRRRDIVAWVDSHDNGATKRGGRPRNSHET
jgi:predicted DNA-binding transcriptional regulator AlpA